jgi:hypothetical protein
MKTSKKNPITACNVRHEPMLSEEVDDPLNNRRKEPTYTLLARSEEKGPGVLETVMYLALLIGPIVALLQFVEYRVVIPGGALL